MSAIILMPGVLHVGGGSRHRLAALPLMAEQALASGSPANNPRLASEADIEALYRKVWG